MGSVTWDFNTPTQIIFGSGSITRLSEIIGANRHVLIVTGGNKPIKERIESLLPSNENRVDWISVEREPTIDFLLGVCDSYCDNPPDAIVAVGGGSVIDTGKVISSFVRRPNEIRDYAEVIGKGLPVDQTGLKMVAIPTTAGTGSEVTRNAVMTIPDSHVKVSLRGKGLYPSVAIVDPELTLSLPPGVTASTGMDALTQLIESLVSIKANPFSQVICRTGLSGIGYHLVDAYQDGQNITAREGMSYASLMSGIALANSGLGAVHGFAAVIGGMFGIAHGEICASMLPAVCSVNIDALMRTNSHHPALQIYDECIQLIISKKKTNRLDLIEWLRELHGSIGIRSLSRLGVTSSSFPEIITRTKLSSSIKGNPIVLSDEDLLKILEFAS